MVIITDTGMLMGDVWASCRGPKVTSLLWAVHNDGAILVLPRHVVTETIARLHRRAGTVGDIAFAQERLKTLYLPWAVVVDEVPDAWGAGDPRVEALAVRDPTDLPTARLALALAPCYLLAEDPDITTPGLGVPKWLPIAHAASNEADLTMATFAAGVPGVLAVEGAKAAMRAAARAPRDAQALIFLTLLSGSWWLTRARRGRRIVKRATSGTGSVLSAIGPPLLQIAKRQADGREHLMSKVVVPSATRSLSEVVASVLAKHATHNQPRLSVDVARQIAGYGNLRERTIAVGLVLRAQPGVFTEVARGRFALGHRLPLPRVELDAVEVRDYLERSHRAPFDLTVSPVPPASITRAMPVAVGPTTQLLHGCAPERE